MKTTQVMLFSVGVFVSTGAFALSHQGGNFAPVDSSGGSVGGSVVPVQSSGPGSLEPAGGRDDVFLELKKGSSGHVSPDTTGLTSGMTACDEKILQSQVDKIDGRTDYLAVYKMFVGGGATKIGLTVERYDKLFKACDETDRGDFNYVCGPGVSDKDCAPKN